MFFKVLMNIAKVTHQSVIHGNALEIFGYGVVITGCSGSGKTELSLKLIDRGHKFISDDQVLIQTDAHNDLWIGQEHESQNQFIHLGGIGFVDISAVYGKLAMAALPVKCNLFIELDSGVLDASTRIANLATYIDILEQKVPLVKLHIALDRPLELLVEVLVKKQQQLDGGHDANQIFIDNLKTR